MYNFSKKQKIILGIIAFLVLGVICYYVYAKDETGSVEFKIDDIETSNETEEQTEKQEVRIEDEERHEEEKILVHVSGAVNNEGVVELSIDGRVIDAIEKARRFKK